MNKLYNDDESKLVDDDATNYMVADMHWQVTTPF